MDLTFTITDTGTPALLRLKDIVRSKGSSRAAATGVRREIRQHLRALPPNKKGFPSTGFYLKAAESVSAPVAEGSGATISITEIGIRQQFFGGDINPINAKFLTEANQPQSYGKRAREFDGLKFAYAQDENGYVGPALISTEAFQERGTVRNRRGVGPKPPFSPDSVVYWLYRHVHQEGNKDILPTGEEMADAARLGLRSFIRAKLHDPAAQVEFVNAEEN